MSILGLEIINTFPAKSTANEPEIDGVELAEYIRVCDEIGGVSCTKLTEARLEKLFREENISLYSYPQVVKYLDEHLDPGWKWFGLRPQDVEHLKEWHTTDEGAREVSFADTQYRAPVPHPVLLTIAKVKNAVPDVYFFVSGVEDPEGDPFLLVTSQAIKSYVIECWDEPSFRREWLAK